MKFKVYHAINPTFTIPPILTIEDFKLVAVVTCESLDQVVVSTNTIEHNWWENSGVEVFRDYQYQGFRSTSVGDLVQDEKGDFFFCDIMGWKKVF